MKKDLSSENSRPTLGFLPELSNYQVEESEADERVLDTWEGGQHIPGLISVGGTLTGGRTDSLKLLSL